jgi:hypothetical protein
LSRQVDVEIPIGIAIMQRVSSPYGVHLSTTLVLVIAYVLSACATAPRSDKSYFATSEAKDHPIPTVLAAVPKIAIAGVLQRDRKAAGKHERDLTSKPDELKALTTSVAKGLSQNPTLQSQSLSDLSVGFSCPSSAIAQIGPKPNSCTLPQELAPMRELDQLRSSGYSHLLLLLYAVSKDAGAKETTWGIGPGIPMFTSETTVYYTFTLTARLYELSNGALVTEAIAADADTGYCGVMMIIYPFYSAPDEGRYIESMGQAVGAEIGRRFQRQTP